MRDQVRVITNIVLRWNDVCLARSITNEAIGQWNNGK